MSIEPAGADGSADAARRALLRAALGAVVSGTAGCASPTAAPAPWESRLRGESLVLLGEVHDNAQQHRLRTAV
ncbi:MAG TPA: hypothetical protein VLE45_01465, partial [Burkholderiaceae bacterium]|nr:hypothetical protein [Burkholderiaceae bacterium]